MRESRVGNREGQRTGEDQSVFSAEVAKQLRPHIPKGERGRASYTRKFSRGSERLIIYIIESLIDGKKYVGKTTQALYRRWAEHRYEAKRARKNTALYRALREHGCDSFLCIQVAQAKDSRQLERLEKKWISDLGTEDSAKGFNERIGGGGRTRKHKGKHGPWDEGTKQRIRATMQATAARKRMAASENGDASFDFG